MNDKSTNPAESPGQEDASQPAPDAVRAAGVEEDATSSPDTTAADRNAAEEAKASATAEPGVGSNGEISNASEAESKAATARTPTVRRAIDTEMRQFVRGDLTRAEQALLDALAKSQKVVLLLPTQTKLDTGNWLMRGKVWAACTEDRLLLLAAGRRPHHEAVPFAQLHESLYNHVTGQLVLAPAPKTQVRGLSLTASAAKSLLARFQTKSQGND